MWYCCGAGECAMENAHEWWYPTTSDVMDILLIILAFNVQIDKIDKDS